MMLWSYHLRLTSNCAQVRLNRVNEHCFAEVVGKMELMEPCNSVKVCCCWDGVSRAIPMSPHHPYHQARSAWHCAPFCCCEIGDKMELVGPCNSVTARRFGAATAVEPGAECMLQASVARWYVTHGTKAELMGAAL